jgi:hypothetical protein
MLTSVKMFFKKKAQGLPMTTIILAVLAIIVLIILILIFTGKISLFGQGLASCENKGGICMKDKCSDKEMAEIKGTDCEKLTNNASPYCCLSIT